MKVEILLKLKEMLNKKKECLQNILYVAKEQDEITFAKESDLEIFEKYIDEKEDLILALSKLNQEYEEFIEQMGEASSDNADSDMKQQINLINQEIISLSKEIQVLEGKSKEKFEAYVQQEREKIKNFRLNSQMASNYYKSMNVGQLEDSYFMDQRK
ncbi:hypothetical protein [Lachnoclostridium phytofermentans]|uniref:FlgN family protein n=1 Tax=Lachnoclostridium phytofermentans (strain ATCC 700394 / DSM 18823 / ISDg) TaxID=357809 RepID=A9KSQ7_LACP7|nr:hypothetical protein [Lachnoclostridium phytofermentans]ABX40701.1 hypothetical protein Cphy_0314 [Lachnoclostridium phytofermentans ISDg]